MRFNVGDWLLLAVVYAIAAPVMAGAVRAGLAGPAPGGGSIPFGVHVALFVIGLLLVLNGPALASWLVLRRCIAGLRLGPWILAVVLGVVLGLVANLLAMAHSVPIQRPDILSLSDLLSDDPLHLLAVVATGVAYFLPPGLLLQRLSGVRAWPFVIAGTIGVTVAAMGAPAIRYLLHPAPAATFLGEFVLLYLLGMLQGLIVGAGLYLVARQPVRPAITG